MKMWEKRGVIEKKDSDIQNITIYLGSGTRSTPGFRFGMWKMVRGLKKNTGSRKNRWILKQ